MKNISRRNFLKGSAAMGILAAMGGAGTAIAEGSSAYTFADTVKWDAEYDVVVLGLGFAGMTAAVTAADCTRMSGQYTPFSTIPRMPRTWPSMRLSRCISFLYSSGVLSFVRWQQHFFVSPMISSFHADTHQG